jgi:hypothetical protein
MKAPDSTSRAVAQADPRLQATLVAVGATGATLALLGLAAFGPRAATSILVGAALATLNLWVLARVVAGLLPQSSSRGVAPRRGRVSAAWALLGLVKALGLIGLVWLLMRHGSAFVSPLPLLAGFGALPIGIAIGSLVSDRASGANAP